ncbi:unnamed protein product [Calicophoron daubneyi]|uniref:Peptidase A1 domain-containing protein n=1 Tax=Calicophoron daubneyi TaxID=300641 RepID=A0AAV2TN61_CALDB
MQLLLFLVTIWLYLQLAWMRASEGIKNNRNANNDKTVAVPLIAAYGGFHYAEIGIGTPPQKFKVFFDTWDQNTWITSTKCPAEKYAMCRNHARYDAKISTTSNETTEEISYVKSGITVTGTITEDKVTLGNQIVSHPFGEANATNSETLATAVFDGSFGMGCASTGTGRPTILQSLVKSGVINKQVFGVYAISNANGEIMFGGYNEALYSGDLEFERVKTKTEWVFGIKRIVFGNEDLTGKNCQGILDDGSHYIFGPTEQVKKIYKQLTCDPSKLCEVDCTKVSTLPQLKITFGKTEFIIGPEDYIDKKGNKCTGRIFDVSQHVWALGTLFLDKVYTAYDVGNAKIGFAHAKTPSSTLSPTARSTTAMPTMSTTRMKSTTKEPTTTKTGTTPTKESRTATTQGPQPTTTSAVSTLSFNYKSIGLVLVMAVFRYLQM